MLDGALNLLERVGVGFDRAAAAEAARCGDVVVGWCAGIRVDLVTPSIPFAWEAMRTSVGVRGLPGEDAERTKEWDALVAGSPYDHTSAGG